MKNKIIIAVLAVSVLVNAAFAALVFSAGRRGAAIMSVDMPPASSGGAYVSAEVAVSVPAPREGYGGAEFGTVGLDLREGESASLQYIVFYGGKQGSFNMTYLFDHETIGVEYTARGVVIHALKAGETEMQYFSGGGFKTLAAVRVRE
jgi:opacity protein-like surface antigen